MSDHQEPNSTNSGEVPEHEPVVAPLVEESKFPWGPIIGGIAVAGALIGGVWFATGGDDEIDVASTDPTEESTSAEEDSEGERTSDESVGIDSSVTEEASPVEFEEAMEDEGFVGDFAMDSVAFGGGGSSTAIWDGERFVQLNMSISGWSVSTSTDGLDWTETPIAGLPENGYVHSLTESDGVLVGLVDSYDESGSTSFVVSSTNATDWNLVELPSPDGGDAGYGGLAVIDDQAILIRTIYNNGDDPYRLLMDAGILDGNQEEFCGFDYDYENEGGPIDVLICNYEEYEENEPTDEEIEALAARYDEAETDEERRAIERELDELWGGGGQEVLLTISPGDPLHAELTKGLFGESESNMSTEVLTGPVGGPFTVATTLDQNGYLTSGLIRTDSAVFAGFDDYDEATGTSQINILTSTDGVTWSDAGSPPPATQGGSLQGFGNVLFFMGYGDNGQSDSFISTDGAATWVPSTLQTDLFDTYTQFAASEAGIVALTQGGLEPYSYNEPDFSGPDSNPVLEKEGFTLELGWNDGTLTLTGPDGLVISLTEEEAYTGEEEVVRMNPISGSLTFLDPETGDDLITFTQDDFEEAYGSFEEEYYVDEEYEEPARGLQAHFSLDGTSWTELDSSALNTDNPNSFAGLVGVGDDEVVFFVETYTEQDYPQEIFAFEEEGREPTDAEIEAIQLWEENQSTIEYVRIPLG